MAGNLPGQTESGSAAEDKKDEILIHTRKKGGQEKLGSGRPPVRVSRAVLESHFSMPMMEACKKLVSAFLRDKDAGMQYGRTACDSACLLIAWQLIVWQLTSQHPPSLGYLPDDHEGSLQAAGHWKVAVQMQ